MATTNGTLKYKQDDGSIVELNPVGVDNTARTSLNAQAKQILCIEQTTGYPASPADVPATSMKATIEALSTKVENLENASNKTQFRFPAFGTVIDCTASSVTVAFPLPEELYSALNYNSDFSVSLATVSTLQAGGSSTVAYCATYTTEQALVAFTVNGKRLSVNKELGYLYATFNTGNQDATKCKGMPVAPFRDQSFYSVPFIYVVLG